MNETVPILEQLKSFGKIGKYTTKMFCYENYNNMLLWKLWEHSGAFHAAWSKMGRGVLWRYRPADLSLGNIDCDSSEEVGNGVGYVDVGLRKGFDLI